MPDIKNHPELTDVIDVPPLAPDDIMAQGHHDAQPALDAAAEERRARIAQAAKERNARKAQERAEHEARLVAVEALQVRCKAVRRKRTSNFLEMLDLIAEMPAFAKRRRRAIIAEMFGLGRAEANRLLKIGQLDAAFREFMLDQALAPELIEALLRAPENVREIALAQIEQGEVIEKSDLTRFQRELNRSNPAVAAAIKNRALTASLIDPIRKRLKDLQTSMNAMVPMLLALHRLGENAANVEQQRAELIEFARLRVADFEACFGKDRLAQAIKQERLTDSVLSGLGDDDVRERFLVSKELSEEWSWNELRAAQTYEALRKLATGNFMPANEYDEDTDYYLSRYILESIAWYADHDLTEYQAELEKLKRPQSQDQSYHGPFSGEEPRLTSIELCAGAGGEAIGLHLAGFEPLGVFEMNRNAAETLKKNCPFGPLFVGDLRNFDFKPYRGKIDLLAGGLPCQPHSTLGRQERDQDSRDLFTTAIQIVKDVQPRAIMFENTTGFLQRPGKLYVTQITSELRQLGYSVKVFEIAASEYGLAQRRPRVVLVGFRDGLMRQFAMPPKFPEWETTLGGALHDLMAENGWRGAVDWARKANKVAPTIVGASSRSGSMGFSSKLRYGEWASIGIDATKLADTAPSANDGEDILPRLTLAMGARLQGFPEGWQFQGSARQQRHQVANAFPPIVAAAVGLAIRKSLTGRDVDFESTLSNLRFVPGKPVHVWWGDEYKNSRLTMHAEELGLPTGIVPRNVPRPLRMREFWKEAPPTSTPVPQATEQVLVKDET